MYIHQCKEVHIIMGNDQCIDAYRDRNELELFFDPILFPKFFLPVIYVISTLESSCKFFKLV